MMLSTVSSNPALVGAGDPVRCTVATVMVKAATPQAILGGMGMSIQFGFRRTEPPHPPSTVQNSARFFFHGAVSYASPQVDLRRPNAGHAGGGGLLPVAAFGH